MQTVDRDEEAQFKRQKLNDKGTNQSRAQVARLQSLAVLDGGQMIANAQ